MGSLKKLGGGIKAGCWAIMKEILNLGCGAEIGFTSPEKWH